MNRDITMLILSCDKFSDLWDGHIKQLEKHWPDRNIKTIIVTDVTSDKSYPGVEIFSAGNEVEWSDRLQMVLDKISTKYVFVTLDDYFLIKDVSNSRINQLLNAMEKECLDYIRLFKRPTHATNSPILSCKKLFSIDCSYRYSVNLYAGIWKKEFLKACVAEPLNPWQFEVSLPKMATAYDAKGAVSKSKDFVILDVVRKGKLLHTSYFYFKFHPGIYEGNRAVNTYWYEFKLAIKTLVGRYTPMPIHNFIKKIMRKFGYQFFSE